MTINGFIAVPLPQVADNPFQPRSAYDPTHILELARSIKRLKTSLPVTQGMQQVPLARLAILRGDGTLEPAQPNLYLNGRAERVINEERNTMAQLMFGHSRLRALMLLNDGLRYVLKHDTMCINFNSIADVATVYADLLDPDPDYATMPMMLGYADDRAMWRHAITENSQRKNITAIDEAVSLQRAIEELGLTAEEAGKPFGFERSTTANKLRLLKLPVDVQKQIADGELTERHGRALLKLVDDPDRVRKAACTAVKKGQNVRQLEESVTWEERSLKAEQEQARQLAHVRSIVTGWQTPMGETLTPDRVSDLEDWNICTFQRNDAKDRILVEQGGCNAGCECMALVYREYNAQFAYRPDPDNAPNVCLGCLNHSEYNEKRDALGDVTSGDVEVQAKMEAENERKRRIEAINNEAHDTWQRWLRDQDKHALWNSIGFWRAAAKSFTYSWTQVFDKSADPTAACKLILEQMYRNTREHNSELREFMHTVEATKKLIKALSGVSQETDGTDGGTNDRST
jgi:ParB-like chromosome segregation protein Spo0J